MDHASATKSILRSYRESLTMSANANTEGRSPFGIKPDERVSFFIDGANLYGAYKELGFDVDYKRLIKHFDDNCKLMRGYYYTAVDEEAEVNPLRPLLDFLEFNGYRVVTKQVKEFVNSMGMRRVKGNMNVELTVDMLKAAAHSDHLILFSGDGDYTAAVAAVQDMGPRVSVVSARKEIESPMIAEELRRQADRYVDLVDVQHIIERAERRPDAPTAERRMARY